MKRAAKPMAPPHSLRSTGGGGVRREEPDCQNQEVSQDRRPARLQTARRPLHQAGGSGPNRLRPQVARDRPDRAWVPDSTSSRTYEGWLYLAVVMALYSRRIIGWSMKATLAKASVLDALLMAVWRRKPEQNVIIQSDQGSQFSSDEWTRFCQTHGLLPSMSRRGNCYDNAVVESFFGSLKKEKIRRHIFKTRETARAELLDYIEVFYNRARHHQHLGNISPADDEQQMAKIG